VFSVSRRIRIASVAVIAADLTVASVNHQVYTVAPGLSEAGAENPRAVAATTAFVVSQF
jgi:hypothetical protein